MHRSACPIARASNCFRKRSADEKVQLIFLDDASDPSTAVKNAQKLIADDNIDILIGGSNTPASQAMAAVTSKAGVQQVSLAPAGYAADKNNWLIAMPQPADIWAKALVKDMLKRKVKTDRLYRFQRSVGRHCL